MRSGYFTSTSKTRATNTVTTTQLEMQQQIVNRSLRVFIQLNSSFQVSAVFILDVFPRSQGHRTSDFFTS
jgi:hypothetical protein